MRLQRIARRAVAAATLALVLVGAAPPAHAQQVADITLQASGTFTRAVFSFGGHPFVDVFTPAQTGAASSAGFTATAGITSLLALNPLASGQASWDAAAMTPLAGNATLAAYLDGSSLGLTLPGGTGNGPLVLSNSAAGFRFTGVGNNAREIGPGDLLFLPGGTDLLLLSMEGAFDGAGLQLGGAAAGPVTMDLLADPMFRASYNGAGALAGLGQLIVRVQPGATRTLAAADLSLRDPGGDALASLLPPAVLAFADFAPAAVSLRFSGTAALSMDRADYTSTAAFDAATAFWAASDFQDVGIEEFARWTATPVPEPGRLAMLLAGLGLVLAATRRTWAARPGHARRQRDRPACALVPMA